MKNDHQGFVHIKSVYTSKQERQLGNLKDLYNNRAQLINDISDIAGTTLNKESLSNKRVLLKPNWVRHSKNEADEICLRTHDNFLLAALEYVLQSSPKEVVIGDAPVQGCKWNKMVGTSLLKAIDELQVQYNIPILIKDFRRVTFDDKANNISEERKPLSEYLIFDVGKESFLEPISDRKNNKFRVTVYNPDRFLESHTAGMHKYCITRQLFQSDVIISLPKVKTHQKAGITAALKNIVGLNGDKDFLPHHRIGGTSMGGDCYPGGNIFRYWSELCQDNANRNKGKKMYWFWLRLSSLLWRISFPKKVHQAAAGWYGNDTTWRMVLDLNTIIHFGKEDGTIANTLQRSFFSLCDGIVGGQGDGPLDPDPLNLGVMSFTNDSAWNDICMAYLMGMDIDCVPLLVNAKNFISGSKPVITFNGKIVEPGFLKQHSVSAIMPPGWLNYLQSKK
jgi:uncharacterized protein (DUF362 family)